MIDIRSQIVETKEQERLTFPCDLTRYALAIELRKRARLPIHLMDFSIGQLDKYVEHLKRIAEGESIDALFPVPKAPVPSRRRP